MNMKTYTYCPNQPITCSHLITVIPFLYSLENVSLIPTILFKKIPVQRYYCTVYRDAWQKQTAQLPLVDRQLFQTLDFLLHIEEYSEAYDLLSLEFLLQLYKTVILKL